MAVSLLLGVCFVAGLAARTEVAQRMVGWLENVVLSNMPGYAFMKGVGEELAGNDPSDKYASVLVSLDDGYLLGFVVERLESGHSVVFLPGAPRPWDGDVMIVDDKRITVLTQSSTAAVNCLRKRGAGTGELVAGKLR